MFRFPDRRYFVVVTNLISKKQHGLISSSNLLIFLRVQAGIPRAFAGVVGANSRRADALAT